jgi:two-component system sensor histidine kinase/response regulator
MQLVSDETRMLRRTMRDLVALSALPAVWAGYRPPQVAEGLADVLLSTLRLDLVYLRLRGQTDGQGIEVARTAGGSTPTDQTRDIGRALAPWLEGAAIDLPPLLPNPIGPGTVRVIAVPIGCGRQVGILVAGSQQTAFPSEEDRLLLSVGANQAAAVLQREWDEEALRESEERYRSVITAMQEGVVLMGADGCIRACNASAERILGLGAEEIMGRTTFDPRWHAIHEDGSAFPGETHPVTLTLRTGRPCSNVVMGVRKPSGELTWVSINSQPLLRGDEPIPYAVVASVSDITERKKTVEALRESERRWRSLTETLPQLVWTATADGLLDYASAQIVQYMGRPESELKGWGWLQMLHPDDLERTRQAWQDAIGKGRSEYEIEHRFRRFDGTYRWFKTRGVAMRDSEDNVDKWLGTCTDIATDKQLEAELRQANDRLDLAVRGSNLAIWEVDMPDGHVENGCLTLINAWESLGYDPAEAPTDFAGVFILAVHAEDQARVGRAIQACLDGETREFDVEYQVPHKDGSIRWHLTRGTVLRDPKGRPIRFIGSRVDITDLKYAEDALRESEQRWRSLTEALPQLVWAATPDGSCDYFSTQWTEHTGVAEGELLGWRWLETLHPEDREPTRQFWLESVAGCHPYDVEYRVRRRDGEYRWFKTRGVPIRDSEGNTIKWFGTCTDITDGKRAEDQLRQLKDAAEAANRAKDEFLANVSHEIRTPMNAILGMTDLVLDTPLAEDQRQCLNTVKSAADNLLGIINDLLDFSKIESGKLMLDLCDYSLRTVVGDTLRALAVRAHRKGLELVCNVQPDVPDSLVGDPGRLRQVILNLVGNAIKFTEQGEVVVRVTVGVTSDEWRVTSNERQPEAAAADASSLTRHSPLVTLHFSVRDTGIGIPRNKQATVFRAFEQEDASTTRKYGGTGLGLTIAARLVGLMDGRISVESEPGQGSTFAFTARFGLQPHPAQPIATRPPVLLRNLPVLIVDDNATNRHILQEWLRDWQMEADSVGDAAAAMDALWNRAANGRPYALALLDARMPNRDGLTLAAMIRERAELSSARLILLTLGGDRPGDPTRYRELRIDAHLLKPVQQEELLETIHRVMQADGDRWRMAAEDGSAPSSSAHHPPLATRHPLRILVAEDNEFSASLMEQLLTRRGHRLRLANNGQEALALAQEGGFDVLLLDLHMPGLDGFGVVGAIRERERAAGGHLPVIALTARSRREDRERCLAAGMDDFLTKPVAIVALFESIDRLVRTDEGARIKDESETAPASDSSFLLPTSSIGEALLDPAAVLTACGDDAELLRRMGRDFQTYAPARLAEVGDALRDRDAPRLRQAAHKFSALLFAFSTTAGKVASDLEDRATEGQLEEARPLVAQLATMTQALMRLAAGLSLDTLRQQVEAARDS